MGAPKGNKYAIGNNGGCPPHYETPEQLGAAVDAYFEWIKGEGHEVVEALPGKDDDGEPFEVKRWVWDRHPEEATIAGLALYLGFRSRQTLYNYNVKPGFAEILERGRLRVEHSYELALRNPSATGAIFALKQMGWTEVVHNKNTNVNTNTNINAELTREEALAIADMLAKEVSTKKPIPAPLIQDEDEDEEIYEL